MAESSIERIYKLTVDATEAVNQLKKIATSTDDIDKKFSSLADTAKKLGAAITVALGAKEFIGHILETAEAFDALGKEAAKVGVGVEALQKLRYAAELSDLPMETLDKALTKLSVGISNLDDPTNATAQALRALGVAAGTTADSALEKIADRFEKMPDGVAKTNLAVELFGERIGTQLIPFLNGGSAAIKQAAEELERFGGIIGADVIAQAEKFNDNLTKLKTASEAGSKQFVSGMLPALERITTAFVGLVSKSEAFKSFGAGVGAVLKEVVIQGALFAQVIRTIGSDIGGLAAWVASGFDSKVFDAWMDDLDTINTETETFINTLDSEAEAQGEVTKKVTETTDATKQLVEVQKSLTDSLKIFDTQARNTFDEWLKQHMAILKIQQDVAKQQDAYNALISDQASAELAASTVRNMGFSEATQQEKAAAETRANAIKQYEQFTDAIGETATTTQTYLGLLDELDGKYDEVSNRRREWLQQKLNAKDSPEKAKLEEMTALESGWGRFVDTIAQGSVSVSQAFSAMVKSIIADLLKIWAKKYIIEAIFGTSGGGAGGAPKGGAQGLVFEAGAVTPFALGGVLSGPVRVPMALMGEAGPEAVMPLQRGTDGNLGVRATGGGLRVAIHNYAGAQVSARRDAGGDLQVIIEAAKQAIAADFRRGGNEVSRSAEAAWRLSRGAAARY